MHQALDLLMRLGARLGVAPERGRGPLEAIGGLMELELQALDRRDLGARGGGLIADLESVRESPAILTMIEVARRVTVPPPRPRDAELFGQYRIARSIACDPTDTCFEALAGGSMFERSVFMRRFPRERMSDALIEANKRWAKHTGSGVAHIFDFGVVQHEPYITSQLVRGASIRDLAQSLHRRGRTLPLSIGLVLFAEARSALEAMFGKGIVHGHLTPSRVRLEPLGKVILCIGTSFVPEMASADRDLATLARILFGHHDPAVGDVLAGGDHDALVVAFDRLKEVRPDLDDLLEAVLKPDSIEAVKPLIERHVDPADAVAFLVDLLDAMPILPIA